MELNFVFIISDSWRSQQGKVDEDDQEDLITLTTKILGSDVLDYICKSVSNDVLPGGIGEVEP